MSTWLLGVGLSPYPAIVLSVTTILVSVDTLRPVIIKDTEALDQGLTLTNVTSTPQAQVQVPRFTNTTDSGSLQPAITRPMLSKGQPAITRPMLSKGQPTVFTNPKHSNDQQTLFPRTTQDSVHWPSSASNKEDKFLKNFYVTSSVNSSGLTPLLTTYRQNGDLEPRLTTNMHNVRHDARLTTNSAVYDGHELVAITSTQSTGREPQFITSVQPKGQELLTTTHTSHVGQGPQLSSKMLHNGQSPLLGSSVLSSSISQATTTGSTTSDVIALDNYDTYDTGIGAGTDQQTRGFVGMNLSPLLNSPASARLLNLLFKRTALGPPTTPAQKEWNFWEDIFQTHGAFDPFGAPDPFDASEALSTTTVRHQVPNQWIMTQAPPVTTKAPLNNNHLRSSWVSESPLKASGQLPHISIVSIATKPGGVETTKSTEISMATQSKISTPRGGSLTLLTVQQPQSTREKSVLPFVNLTQGAQITISQGASDGKMLTSKSPNAGQVTISQGASDGKMLTSKSPNAGQVTISQDANSRQLDTSSSLDIGPVATSQENKNVKAGVLNSSSAMLVVSTQSYMAETNDILKTSGTIQTTVKQSSSMRNLDNPNSTVSRQNMVSQSDKNEKVDNLNSTDSDQNKTSQNIKQGTADYDDAEVIFITVPSVIAFLCFVVLLLVGCRAMYLYSKRCKRRRPPATSKKVSIKENKEKSTVQVQTVPHDLFTVMTWNELGPIPEHQLHSKRRKKHRHHHHHHHYHHYHYHNEPNQRLIQTRFIEPCRIDDNTQERNTAEGRSATEISN